MVDALDLLHCPDCGAYYKPKITDTGRMVPHCTLTVKSERGGLKWIDGEVYVDFTVIEARTLARMGLTDVVDPPLTVTSGRRYHLFGLGLWEVLLLIALAAFLIWVDTSPAYGQCVMSYCKPGVSERTTITNTHRQKIGDLYQPAPGQRTHIRDQSRRIIGYIETDGSITNTHRQKKGQLND